ncbi:MAG: DUF3105 domain-containing protein, partial [Actinomycetota bacterium]|nr:DUF3105 domain-containing protein [Actinomycetota bacterium]
MIRGLDKRFRVVVCASVALGVLGVLVFAACGEEDEPATTTTSGSAGEELDANGFPVNAHVEPALGVVPEGIELDGREGTPPPAVAEPDLEAAADAAGCELETGLPDEGNNHLSDEDVPDVEYGTNPPTSGDHYGDASETLSGALADGAYLELPPIGRYVHALEHQRVAIQYSPDLPDADQLALKGVFDEDPAGVLFFPNPEMPYDVAVTGWTNLLGCETFEGDATLDAVR